MPMAQHHNLYRNSPITNPKLMLVFFNLLLPPLLCPFQASRIQLFIVDKGTLFSEEIIFKLKYTNFELMDVGVVVIVVVIDDDVM